MPLVPKGKAPDLGLLRSIYGDTRTRHLREAPALAEEVALWFERSPSMNLGAFPGVGGLVVADIDKLDVLDPDVITPMAWSGRPEGGKHVYLVSSDLIPTDEFEWGHLNPAHIVLPGSIHPDGPMYEWLPGLAPWEVPFMTLDDALEALGLMESGA